MTKKEYCLNNEAISVHYHYRMQIHGIEYAIKDGKYIYYAYISRLYQKTYCGETYVMFHKVKFNYDMNDNVYFIINARKFNGKREKLIVNLNGFICVTPWATSAITCKELASCNY